MASIPSRLAAPASLALHAALYIVIGWVSFSTAYLQPNTATIWLSSGFALGLLLAKGPGFWPSVTLGSFILNSIATPSFSAAALFAAGAIAFGNTAEALFGAYLTRRFANGSAFPYRSRSVTRFMLLVVPVAPLVSTAIGVSASVWSGIPMTGTIGDVALTWYIANAQGILLFGGLDRTTAIAKCQPAKGAERRRGCCAYVGARVRGPGDDGSLQDRLVAELAARLHADSLSSVGELQVRHSGRLACRGVYHVGFSHRHDARPIRFHRRYALAIADLSSSLSRHARDDRFGHRGSTRRAG